MVARCQIAWIMVDNGGDTVEAITHVGGHGLMPWRATVAEIVRLIESRGPDRWEFFLRSEGDEVDVIVAMDLAGRKHLCSRSGSGERDLLLDLHRCFLVADA